MNSFLDHILIPFISDKPTILVGAGVYHPAPGPGNFIFSSNELFLMYFFLASL
ncbi:hypothetical protein GLOIN_2v1505085 [Rhizophagus irregularis DAOM 181602=DAOM 197198]|uniref:Uncharacterized protein n=1 Tax=Rhizophagus irregularis (strain DAOM 181602 / DAOM 197198 / MUCL 43194) TaxID=747089 RepID=A0A2P4QVS1_RHIID|nr:hypothetical protein GLOIN_2v1505085 [Rhizophagus irregularis DAOM 181602=DAOM 197198]POG81764.1 hypothetical protein GLOIN_2v1505085 [Rhizophagus irregularis DAOM 181602=DAOM 197198]|eukprot:XP_025188630.1 hypothetical protein GLOIN_2v1505085 [Rhizophagus irregularis DAOM 181602=DAOM 197198]